MVNASRVMITTYIMLLNNRSTGFLHSGSGYRQRMTPPTPSSREVDLKKCSSKECSKLWWESCSSRRRVVAASAAPSEGREGDVLLKFIPSGVEVACQPGEVVLEVASRCSGMPEDSTNPFCRNGGCYNCEVEVVEAGELGMVDNLVRACMFKIPEGVKQLSLVQMNSEEAFEEML